jgi:anti-anti-sigma factor
VDGVNVTREGAIDIVSLAGEYDLSNVGDLDDALQEVLSDETASCLLDLSGVTFMDSTVVHALIRWSKEAQVSEREALAIMVGGHRHASCPRATTSRPAAPAARFRYPICGQEGLGRGQTATTRALADLAHRLGTRH